MTDKSQSHLVFKIIAFKMTILKTMILKTTQSMSVMVYLVFEHKFLMTGRFWFPVLNNEYLEKQQLMSVIDSREKNVFMLKHIFF